MRESDLYRPIIDGAIAAHWPLFRLSDLAPGRKPFDIAGCAPGGEAVGLEVKVVRSEHAILDTEPLPWHLLEASQRGWLEAYAKAGAFALAGFYLDVVRHKSLQPSLVIYRMPPLDDWTEVPAIALWAGRLRLDGAWFTGWDALYKRLAQPPHLRPSR